MAGKRKREEFHNAHAYCATARSHTHRVQFALNVRARNGEDVHRQPVAFDFLNFELVSEFLDAVVLRLYSVLCEPHFVFMVGSAALFSYTFLTHGHESPTTDSGSSRLRSDCVIFCKSDRGKLAKSDSAHVKYTN